MIDILKYLIKLKKLKIIRIFFRRINIFKFFKFKSLIFGLSFFKIIIFKLKEKFIKDDDDKLICRNNVNLVLEIRFLDVFYQIEICEIEDILLKLNLVLELIKMILIIIILMILIIMIVYIIIEILIIIFKIFLLKMKFLKIINFILKFCLSVDIFLEIIGQDLIGIFLDGLMLLFFGQFFLIKVDLEKELDLQKDVEYILNKVSNFFNLEDFYQLY